MQKLLPPTPLLLVLVTSAPTENTNGGPRNQQIQDSLRKQQHYYFGLHPQPGDGDPG